MASDPEQVQAVFLKAVELPATERPALLDRECAGDAELRRRVETLLLAHDQSGSFLDRPVEPALSASATRLDGSRPPRPTSLKGAQVGPYTLLEPLGEGGMGAVWVAEQTEPVKRRVALKLIKPGLDSAQIVRRFEAERQALALMEHANIARVFDAGTTPDGRPYFVMELVQGAPITQYCDLQRLPLRERLDLFIAVCRAIQHAHQKGIIHRDVKPSNVLVTLQDGRPVPKVIDFGIAKAIDQRLTDASLFTAIGQVVGTLDYMAPEQADPSGVDVDTRADVYALGAMLYELLTGTTPLDGRRLKGVSLLEVLRRIREEEPPRPSARASESNAPRAREVRGDLDWIAMKALEKDRARRYETATGLARDVERHLADEPVEACPPSRRYRLGKFLRKHRAGVLTAAALVTLLVLGATVSAWQAVRATAAEGKAVAEGVEKDKERAKAVAERERADEEAADAKAVSEFLRYDLLLQADTAYQATHGFAADPNLSVRAVLDRAAALIGDRFGKRPRVEAAIRQAIGVAYEGIGESAKAVEHLERALALRQARLAPDHADTLSSMDYLGLAHLAAGRLDKALPLLEQALAKRREKLGPDDRDTLGSMVHLARGYREDARPEKALPLLEQAHAKLTVKPGPDHPDTLTTAVALAGVLAENGHLDKALPLLEQALAKLTVKPGPDYPHTLLSTVALAAAYREDGRPEAAVRLLEESLARQRVRFSADHPQTLLTAIELALACRETGQPGRAVSLLEEVLAKQRARLPRDHPRTLLTMGHLARGYRDAGDFSRALRLAEETLAKQRKGLSHDHPHTLLSMNNLAVLYADMNELDRAILLFEKTLDIQKAKRGERHLDTLQTMANLGSALHRAGRPGAAIPLLERAFRARHRALARAGIELLGACNAAGKTEQAAAFVPEVIAIARKLHPPGSSQLANVLFVGGATLSLTKAYAKAEPILRECLVIRREKQPDDWTAFNAASALGAALLGQKKYAEAEPWLLRGYTGLYRRAAKIPEWVRKAHLGDAAQRLVDLYLDWGKWGDAGRWLNELTARRKR